MSFMNNLYNNDEKDKKFRLTRGKLILFAIGIILIIAMVIVIIVLVNKKKPQYTTSDFNKLEKRMVEEAPFYLEQKNITLDSDEYKIDLKNMLVKNGGTIDPSKIIAAKICDGYVIVKKESSINYNAYIKCGNKYMTNGYLSNDTTTNSNKTTSSKDVTKPDIVIIGDSEITITVGSNYEDQGAKATDNEDGDITSKIKVTGNVDTSKEGNYVLTYSVSDKAGNKDSKNRIIYVVPKVTTTVTNETTTTIPSTTTKKTTKSTTKITTRATTKKPTTPPTITLRGDKTITIYIGSNYNDPGYSAKDSLGKDITSKVKVTSNINTSIAGVYYVTYSVTDNYGNSSSATRTISVKASTVPLTGLSISPNSVNLKKGSNKKLEVYFSPTNATNKTISWSSSNSTIATVNSNGVVTAKNVGTVIITVKSYNGLSATSRITVVK